MQLQSSRPHWRPETATECEACSQQNDCFLATRLPDDQGPCRAAVQRRFTLDTGDRLYRLGEACTALFQVCRGAIKTQRETVDGDLVVTGFFLPGDLVGIDALGDNVFPSDAIACSGTEICQFNFQRLLSSCADRPGLNAWIIAAVGRYVRRKDADLAWPSSLQSHQRVLRFFLDLHERLNQQSNGLADTLSLPMRKQDIARYLNVTPETLSRNLARLKRDGLLQVRNDHFRVPDAERARYAAGA